MGDYMNPVTPKTTNVLRDGETNELVWQGPLWEFARDNDWPENELMFRFQHDTTVNFGGGASPVIVAHAIVY